MIVSATNTCIIAGGTTKKLNVPFPKLCIVDSNKATQITTFHFLLDLYIP